ncbi:MAG: hypothetical protein O2954_14025 [bacterium]|nr:hypothetical protein [bacterium]
MPTAKASWATIETTPPLGLPMGGRGPRFTPGASVLDPLFAQALILEDAQKKRTLWISVDVVTMAHDFTDLLRYDLSALTTIPMDAIVINFSHTHSGPMLGYEGYSTLVPKPTELHAYESDLRRRILRIALEAMGNLKPVTVTLHRGTSEVGINRRRKSKSGEMGMGPNPEGSCNPDLWVLDLSGENGRCVVFNYGCHPVIVYGYAWDGISADYPGVCRNRLKEKLGANTHCQFIQGLAGNVRPRVLADMEAGKFRKPKPEDPIAAGTQLSNDVIRALNNTGETLTLNLAAATGRFLAPRDQAKIPPLDHWQSLCSVDDELSRNLGEYWTHRIKSGIPPVRTVPWYAGLIRLTPEHRIAWIAGEVLAEWLGHLRTWLNDENLIAWGYCQDGRGYLPTDELIPQGGYEVDRSSNYSTIGPGPFEPRLNEAVRDVFLSLAKQIAV